MKNCSLPLHIFSIVIIQFFQQKLWGGTTLKKWLDTRHALRGSASLSGDLWA